MDKRTPHCHCYNIDSDDRRCNFGSDRILSRVVGMNEVANIRKREILLISAGIEMILIICILIANLNPTPVWYFIFYNLLYGLIFSFLVPLFYLWKKWTTGFYWHKKSWAYGNGLFYFSLLYVQLVDSWFQRWISVLP